MNENPSKVDVTYVRKDPSLNTSQILDVIVGKDDFPGLNGRSVALSEFDKVGDELDGLFLRPVQIERVVDGEEKIFYNYINRENRVITDEWSCTPHSYSKLEAGGAFGETRWLCPWDIDGKIYYVDRLGRRFGEANKLQDSTDVGSYLGNYSGKLLHFSLHYPGNVETILDLFNQIQDLEEGLEAPEQYLLKLKELVQNSEIAASQKASLLIDVIQGAQLRKVDLHLPPNLDELKSKSIIWGDLQQDFDQGKVIQKKYLGEYKYNFFRKNCTLVHEEWFDEIGPFVGQIAPVKKGGKWNFARKSDGEFIYDIEGEFDCIGKPQNGCFRVKRGGRYNFVDSETGTLILKEFCEDAKDFKGEYAEVKINGKWQYIARTGGSKKAYVLAANKIGDGVKGRVGSVLRKDSKKMPEVRTVRSVSIKHQLLNRLEKQAAGKVSRKKPRTATHAIEKLQSGKISINLILKEVFSLILNQEEHSENQKGSHLEERREILKLYSKFYELINKRRSDATDMDLITSLCKTVRSAKFYNPKNSALIHSTLIYLMGNKNINWQRLEPLKIPVSMTFDEIMRAFPEEEQQICQLKEALEMHVDFSGSTESEKFQEILEGYLKESEISMNVKTHFRALKLYFLDFKAIQWGRAYKRGSMEGLKRLLEASKEEKREAPKAKPPVSVVFSLDNLPFRPIASFEPLSGTEPESATTADMEPPRKPDFDAESEAEMDRFDPIDDLGIGDDLGEWDDVDEDSTTEGSDRETSINGGDTASSMFDAIQNQLEEGLEHLLPPHTPGSSSEEATIPDAAMQASKISGHLEQVPVASESSGIIPKDEPSLLELSDGDFEIEEEPTMEELAHEEFDKLCKSAKGWIAKNANSQYKSLMRRYPGVQYDQFELAKSCRDSGMSRRMKAEKKKNDYFDFEEAVHCYEEAMLLMKSAVICDPNNKKILGFLHGLEKEAMDLMSQFHGYRKAYKQFKKYMKVFESINEADLDMNAGQVYLEAKKNYEEIKPSSFFEVAMRRTRLAVMLIAAGAGAYGAINFYEEGEEKEEAAIALNEISRLRGEYDQMEVDELEGRLSILMQIHNLDPSDYEVMYEIFDMHWGLQNRVEDKSNTLRQAEKFLKMFIERCPDEKRRDIAIENLEFIQRDLHGNNK